VTACVRRGAFKTYEGVAAASGLESAFEEVVTRRSDVGRVRPSRTARASSQFLQGCPPSEIICPACQTRTLISDSVLE
jgi:hypothetical protein